MKHWYRPPAEAARLVETRETAERLKMVASCRAVLAGRKLHPVYQPVVSIKDNAIVGYEALIRGPAGELEMLVSEQLLLCEASGVFDPASLIDGRQTIVRRADMAAHDFGHADGDGLVSAPMHGKVLVLSVVAGEKVTKGQRLAVLEAMKMEHTLTSPFAGTVTNIAVTAGSQVAEGARLMTIEPDKVG